MRTIIYSNQYLVHFL